MYDSYKLRKENKNACFGCECNSSIHYKITKDILDKIGEYGEYYETLNRLFTKANQDYIWIECSC